MMIDVFAVYDAVEGEDAKEPELIQQFKIEELYEIANNTMARKEGSSKPKVSLAFELTRSHLLKLNKVTAEITETYMEEVKQDKKKKYKRKSKKEEEEKKKAAEEEAKPDLDGEVKPEGDKASEEPKEGEEKKEGEASSEEKPSDEAAADGEKKEEEEEEKKEYKEVKKPHQYFAKVEDEA